MIPSSLRLQATFRTSVPAASRYCIILLHQQLAKPTAPEWRAATEKRRGASTLYRMRRDPRELEDAVDPPVMVLRVARERADTLGAAVDAIERRAQASGDIMYHLTAYMTGRLGIGSIQYALKQPGIG